MIQINGLSHHYGLLPALNDINLSIPAGELHGLIGPDSAGKTTLIRLLCGLLPLQLGEVSVFALPVRTQFAVVRARVGYMPQRFSLYQDLTVEENLLFFARLFGVSKVQRTALMAELYAFSQLESFKDRKAGALSGGMKQKLALSCALIHRPELLLLDEPTYGVDPVSRQEFWQMLQRINGEGTTLVVSTPYMDEAELCQRVSLLHAGHILRTDTPSTLIGSWRKQVVAIRSPRLREVEQVVLNHPELESCQLFGNELHVVLPEGEAKRLLADVQAALAPYQATLQPIRPGMEDIFLSYMQMAAQNTGTVQHG